MRGGGGRGQTTISCMGRAGEGGYRPENLCYTDRMGPIVHERAYWSLVAHKTVIDKNN